MNRNYIPVIKPSLTNRPEGVRLGCGQSELKNAVQRYAEPHFAFYPFKAGLNPVDRQEHEVQDEQAGE